MFNIIKSLFKKKTPFQLYKSKFGDGGDSVNSEALELWINYKFDTFKHSYTTSRILNKLVSIGDYEDQANSVNNSIKRKYQGLFAPSKKRKNTRKDNLATKKQIDTMVALHNDGVMIGEIDKNMTKSHASEVIASAIELRRIGCFRNIDWLLSINQKEMNEKIKGAKGEVLNKLLINPDNYKQTRSVAIAAKDKGYTVSSLLYLFNIASEDFYCSSKSSEKIILEFISRLPKNPYSKLLAIESTTLILESRKQHLNENQH